MNKLTLSTIIAAVLFSATASAEYMIKIPLERDNGGFLPTGSIVFKSEPEPTPPAPAPIVLTDAQIIETINSYGDPSITFASRDGWVVVNYPKAKNYGCTFSFDQKDDFESYFHRTNISKYGTSVMVEYSFYGTCN